MASTTSPSNTVPTPTQPVSANPAAASGALPPITLETAKEVIRLSELYLDGTIKIALAADSRAMSISGLSSAAASALVIFGLNYVTEQSDINFSLGVAALFAALPFYYALILSLWAASPKSFYISGNLLSRWSDAELRGNLADALMSQAENYNRQGISNSNGLTINGRRIKQALRALAAAPILASLAGTGTYYRADLLPLITPLYATLKSLVGI